MSTDRSIFKHYIRLHNMPRNSNLCGILHFLWEVVDFETEEALICAHSASNIIVGFTKQEYADESVLYANGRAFYGRIISVHSADEDDLQRVMEDSLKAGPAEGPPRLGKRKNGYMDEENHQFSINSENEEEANEMCLEIPDFWKPAPPPDTIECLRRPHSTDSSAGQMTNTNSSSSNRSAENSSQEIEVISTKRADLMRKGEHEVRAAAPGNAKRNAQMPPYHPPAQKVPRFEKPLPLSKFATGSNAFPMGAPRLSSIPLPPDNVIQSAINLLNTEIQLTISSKHCFLKWNLPPAESNCTDFHVLELIENNSTQIIIRKNGKEKQQHLLETTEGNKYELAIKSYDKNKQQFAFGLIKFRATFSITEMEKLLAIASRFCSGEMFQFSILHRCKPRDYFDKIYNEKDGLRLMKPYLKDENGHRGSPINSQLHGFFLSALLITDELPDKSPFGDVQMIIEAEKILDFERMNMYFADFYCNELAGAPGQSSSLHYITVVICAKRSEPDKFCAQHLKKLDPLSNKFLRIVKNQGKSIYLMAARRDLLVEVYYTEAISLFDAKQFRKITPMGRGSSKPTGLPNNKECRICNNFQ